MRTIKVSEVVWNKIAERGKFGETEDDALRRVFGLPALAPEQKQPVRRGRGAIRYATKRMSARVENGTLIVAFEDGARHEWPLPNRVDKVNIRNVRQAAVAFALENGASDPGQTNAVRKALTDAGYHLTK